MKTIKHSTMVKNNPDKLNLNEGFSWKLKPICPEAFEAEAERMIKFYEDNPKKIMLVSYAIHRKMHLGTLYKWLRQSKALKEAYEYCRQLLWERRYEGISYGTLKEKPIMRDMYRYSKEWKEDDIYWSELNNKEEIEQGKTVLKVVEVQSFKEDKQED